MSARHLPPKLGSRPKLTTPPNFKNRFSRAIWGVTWFILARPTPAQFHIWRCSLLRLFGAKIAGGVAVYSSAKIWAPWNLEMEEGSCLARGAICYNVAGVTIKKGAVVSQRAYLCSAGHDIHDPGFPLVSAPIVVGEHAWVAAEAYVGPGVLLGEGAVIAARSVCVKSVDAWCIVGGNPAKEIGTRSSGDRL